MNGSDAGFAILLGAIIGIAVLTVIATTNLKKDIGELKQTLCNVEEK